MTSIYWGYFLAAINGCILLFGSALYFVRGPAPTHLVPPAPVVFYAGELLEVRSGFYAGCTGHVTKMEGTTLSLSSVVCREYNLTDISILTENLKRVP